MSAEKELTGRIARERIRMMTVPALPDGVAAGFAALGDASGLVSDTLDELGIPGALPASVYRPTIAGACIVGPALTLRNKIRARDPVQSAKDGVNGMAEYEAHNLAQMGDVLVIEGVSGMSNMGGLSAQAAKRQGEAGAIVSGGIRDVASSRALGYPIWASEITPITGKWRLETVEINGVIQIGGVSVSPGDLVIADDTGICFVPRERVVEVLKIVQKKAVGETQRRKAFDSGVPLPTALKTTTA